jgi:RimJ/RimL family protein N-acetyltransferase
MSSSSQAMNIQPTALEGRHVRLEPLQTEHIAELAAAGADDSLSRYLPYPIHTPPQMHEFVAAALDEQARGISVPFATIDRVTAAAVGSTRFMNIDRAHRRVEIGGTWIAPAAQRTAINTEAKYLMLRHAFETWGCIRVELKTDSLNERSRAAIARIGAKEEGTFRNHMITWTGRIRHSVYFSITAEEWPGAKARLEQMLAR